MFANERTHPRLPVVVPVCLHLGDGRTIAAITKDISYTGCRVRVEYAALGVEDDEELSGVIERVRQRLDKGFRIEFLPPDDKAWELSKPAVLVRMARVGGVDGGNTIDLGCLFGEPVREEELDRLDGLIDRGKGEDGKEEIRRRITWNELRDRIPTGGGTVVVARPPTSNVPEPTLPEVETLPPRERARLMSQHAGQETFQCRVEQINHKGVLVHMAGVVKRLNLASAADLATAALVFTQRYGDRVRFRIGADESPLWEGICSVFGFELGSTDDDLRVSLEFLERFDDQAKVRLGLDRSPTT